MNGPVHQRKVTRSFVLAVAGMTTVLALSLLVATWGFIALATGTSPIHSDVPCFLGPSILALALAELFWMLWRTALALLRGRSTPPWSFALFTAALGYLTWGVIGSLAGLSTAEAWASVYPLVIAFVWFLSVHLFWLLLARQVFTTRTRWLWPWEKREMRDLSNSNESSPARDGSDEDHSPEGSG